MISGVSANGDELLFHYTSRDTALEHILSGDSLRLSPFGKVNDPRDAKERAVVVAFSGNGKSPIPINDVARCFTERTRRFCKLLCMTCDDRKGGYPIGSNHSVHARGYGRLRMWAQYGQDHAGVCLVFNKEALVHELQKQFAHSCTMFHHSVTYGEAFDESIDATTVDIDGYTLHELPQAIDKHVRQYHQHFFFRKALDWNTEAEWRAVICGDSSGFEYVSIADSLKAIVLGEQFSKVYRPAIDSAMKGKIVPVFPLVWDPYHAHLILGEDIN